MVADVPRAAATFPSEDHRKSAATLFYSGAPTANMVNGTPVSPDIKRGLEWD